MLSLRSLGVAILLVGASMSQPAAAQGRSGVSSLTHVVSVTVPARVKVKVSSVSLVSGSVPAAVKVSPPASASVNGLAVSVQANKAWVLSVSAPAANAASSSTMSWSGNQSPAAVDATVFFRGGKNGSSGTVPVILTVSAP